MNFLHLMMRFIIALALILSVVQALPKDNERPECIMNSECPRNMSCVDLKCVNSCLGACGDEAECTVVNHLPVCSCPPGKSGNPFVSCKFQMCQTSQDCHKSFSCIEKKCSDPCKFNVCGEGAECMVKNHNPVCRCPDGEGDPFRTCKKPQACVLNAECPQDKACIKDKCSDPCRIACGLGANCIIKDHQPLCTCPPDTKGNPFIECSTDGCESDSECPRALQCINMKCKDPCESRCGVGAECEVFNHRPVCKCPSGEGDPFVVCKTANVVTSICDSLVRLLYDGAGLEWQSCY